MLRVVTRGLLLSAWLALEACTAPCSASTYSGCCQNDVCYEGGGCFSLFPVGGGSGAGGGSGGGSSAVDAGPPPCRREAGESCGAGQACCQTNSEGDPMSCRARSCQKDCKESGPCSSMSECCSSPLTTGYGYYCRLSVNECRICGGRTQRCSTLFPDDCCPGLRCGSKPATPNYYECM